MAWIDPQSPLPAEHSPVALWNRLFSGGVQGTDGPGALVDARRSVLDVVKQDTVALQARLGATDRMRLEAHLDGLRDLENLLDFDLNGCMVPEMPTEPESGPEPAPEPQPEGAAADGARPEARQLSD